MLRPDLKLADWRVVFEYEGEEHFRDVRRWRQDIVRREFFEAAGWRVIRVVADDVFVAPELFRLCVMGILESRTRVVENTSIKQ